MIDIDYFDLHCDTVEKAFKKGESENFSFFDVAVENTELFSKRTQCFALWLDDSLNDKASFEKATQMYTYFKNVFEKNVEYEALLTLENGVSFGGDIENIAKWKKRGAVMASLTWNGENSLGGGAYSNASLSSYGKQCAEQMEKVNMILDVSHLNEKTFFDLCEVLKKPFAASHSNCFSLCSNKRNLKDWQIKEMIRRNCIIGLCFYPSFLGYGDVFERVYRHITHIMSLGGENCLCIGSDFDGAKMNKKLNSTEKVYSLYSYLLKRGLQQEQLNKIFYKNAKKFFNNVLQDE